MATIRNIFSAAFPYLAIMTQFRFNTVQGNRHTANLIRTEVNCYKAILLLYGDSVANSLRALDNKEVRTICSLHSVLGHRGVQRYSYLFSYSLDKITRKFSRGEAANIAMAPAELITEPSQLSFGKIGQLFLPMNKSELLNYAKNPNALQFIDEFKNAGILITEKGKLINPLLVMNPGKAVEVTSSLDSSAVVAIQQELATVFTSRTPVNVKKLVDTLEIVANVRNARHLVKEFPDFLPIVLHEHEGATFAIPSPPSQQEIKSRHLTFLLELMQDPLSLLETTALLSEQATPKSFFEEIPSVVPDALIDPIEKKWGELQSYFLINRWRGYITTLDGERLLCIAYGTPFAYLEYGQIYPKTLENIPLQTEMFWHRVLGFTFWGVVWKALRDNLSKDYDTHEKRQMTARAFENMFSVNVYDVARELGIHPSTVPSLARTLRASGYGGSISLYSHPRVYKKNALEFAQKTLKRGGRRGRR